MGSTRTPQATLETTQENELMLPWAASRLDDTLAYVHERVFGVGCSPRFSIEAGNGLVEAADDFDDLRAGYDLRDRLDNETSLQACYARGNIVYLRHSGTPPSRVRWVTYAFDA